MIIHILISWLYANRERENMLAHCAIKHNKYNKVLVNHQIEIRSNISLLGGFADQGIVNMRNDISP